MRTRCCSAISLHDALREVDRAFPEESPRKDRLLYGNAARLLKL